MRRRAIMIQLFCLVMLLAVAAPVPARAYNLPPCTRAEFRELFDQITRVQIELGGNFSSFAGLLEFASATLAARAEHKQAIPLCADDFAFQRLVTELTGDFVGRVALDLGEVAAAENPYRERLPSEQERIEALAARLLSADRAGAPAPAERSAPKCARDQLTTLADLIAGFFDLLESDADAPLAAIDVLLRWRGANVSRAPICSDGIELALLLSAAATDAASSNAFAFTAPDAGNPYASALADSEFRLSEWHIHLNERLARYGESTTDAPLPACSVDELALAYGKLMPDYTDLLYSGQAVQSGADLSAFSGAYLEFRRTNLARLPACAEVFAAAWDVRQLLGDMLSSAASDIALAPGTVDPFHDRLSSGSARAAQMIDSMASRVEGAGVVPDTEVFETAVACSPAESLLMQVYILPEFYTFADVALAAETADDATALTERSLAFRDLLWQKLPRCAEAIELGLVMRRVAADFVAMLWLELVGLPADDIAQVQAVVDDITRLAARAAALDIDLAGGSPSGAPYYVSAGRGANIRACGSTDCDIVATALSGELVYVTDDSGSWFQVNLPNNQIGYIANFLVSQTPPS